MNTDKIYEMNTEKNLCRKSERDQYKKKVYKCINLEMKESEKERQLEKS